MREALPETLLEYWQGYMSNIHHPVYMQIDPEGRMISCGGDLARFGLKEPLEHMLVEDEVIFLTGLLPLQTERMILPNLETAHGVFADIYLFKEKDGITWVLMMDTTKRETRLRSVIQKSNELQLKELEYRKLMAANIPAQVLEQLDTAVFRVLPENRFQLVGPLPKWFSAMGMDVEANRFCGDVRPTECFPFLEYFLSYEASELWEQPGGPMITSGLWVETDDEFREYYLEAVALWVTDEKILLVRKVDTRDNKSHEHIQTGRERALEYERLNKSKQLLKSFMAEMSHELRTPLTAILGYSQMISGSHGGNLTQQQQKALKLILHSGQRLLTIINNLLDLSRIEAGKANLVKAPVFLDLLFEKLADMVAGLIREKDITYFLKADSNLPRRIITDGEKLHRILINLLGNAAKFTKEGQISLSVSANASQLYFFVKDTGIGISKEHQAEIFESYVQVEGTRADEQRREGSSGLGLNLCQKLVSLLGGKISVRSELGKGSQFTFYIPLETDVADK